MPDLSVTVPEEPADGAVVLGRWQGSGRFTFRRSWQRRVGLWYGVGRFPVFGGPGTVASKTWEHLLVDEGPLTVLVPVDEVDGWQRAGYRDPLAEHLPGPVGGPEAPTPDERPTRAEPDPERPTDGRQTNELGGELREPPVDHVPPRDPRRPVVDRPQA